MRPLSALKDPYRSTPLPPTPSKTLTLPLEHGGADLRGCLFSHACLHLCTAPAQRPVPPVRAQLCFILTKKFSNATSRQATSRRSEMNEKNGATCPGYPTENGGAEAGGRRKSVLSRVASQRRTALEKGSTVGELNGEMIRAGSLEAYLHPMCNSFRFRFNMRQQMN